MQLGGNAPDQYDLIRDGAIDGGVITWEMSPALKLNELTDSHTDAGGKRMILAP